MELRKRPGTPECNAFSPKTTGRDSSAMLRLRAFVVIVRGIAPAMSRSHQRFPRLYHRCQDRGARRGWHGAALRQQQMVPGANSRHYRVESAGVPGKFARRFHRHTAYLLLIPLAQLEPLDALRVLTAVSMVPLSDLYGSPIITDSFAGLISTRRCSSCCPVTRRAPTCISSRTALHISLILLCDRILRTYLKGRPLLAGACFGVFSYQSEVFSGRLFSFTLPAAESGKSTCLKFGATAVLAVGIGDKHRRTGLENSWRFPYIHSRKSSHRQD